MNKQALINKIIEILSREAENLANGARTAHADATGEESKSENKYDTRGLEASYLAGAQAKMAAEAMENVACYKSLEVKDFSENSKIALTALVQLESENGDKSFYFLGPKGGGVEVELDGKKILLITPPSPLGRKIMGKEVGDFIEIFKGKVKTEFEIVAIS